MPPALPGSPASVWRESPLELFEIGRVQAGADDSAIQTGGISQGDEEGVARYATDESE
jgi:hypothetical protein